MQSVTANIPLIFILPLLAAVFALSANFFKFTISQKTVQIFSLTSNSICLLIAAALTCFYMLNTEAEPFIASLDWLKAGDLTVSLGILADANSSLCVLITMLVGLVVQIASAKFLDENKNFNLYFAFINLLLVNAEAILFSSNLIQFVIFALLAGACIYLILNMNADKVNVSNCSKKFLIIDRLGDVCLFFAIFILLYFIKAYELSYTGELLGFKGLSDMAADFYVYMTDVNFYALCILFFVGISAKAGLFPFQSKLLSVSYDYSPASYLILIVMAVTGGLFITRLLPVFELSGNAVSTIYVIFGISVGYTLIYGFLNHFCFSVKNDFSYLMYCCLINIYVILPLTMTSHSDMQNIKVYIVFIVFTILYIAWFVLDIKHYIKNAEIKNINTNQDIIDKIFNWIIDNILDIPRNILRLIDKYVLPFVIDSCGYVFRVISWLISCTQNGKIQHYIIYSVIFTAIMLILYLIMIVGAGEV